VTAPITESLLVFSDVHLGSDLDDSGHNIVRRTPAIDRDLVSFLSHYRRERPSGDRWRIVIAGDFIDFIGMTIVPGEALLDTEQTQEERDHGVGNAADHARLKLRRVAERHGEFFDVLAGFIADGHTLTMVHGNHDIELHWESVQADFRDILSSRACIARPDLDVAAFLARIEFNPWFFYRQGLVYIEHGHQYDPYCSTEHVMSPLSPLDPRRLARGMTDVLLRFVVRRTRGMREHGHEHAGMLDYVRFSARLGLGGLVRVGVRFFSAVREMFRMRRGYLTAAAATLRAEHDRRVALLGEVSRIGAARLRALLSLQERPITASVRGIMACVLLDRLALAAGAAFLLAGVAVAGIFYGYAFFAAIAVFVAWGLIHRQLCNARKVDAAENLALKAPQLAALFPAAFVVMGHTHMPVHAPAGQSTYINLGSWAEEEPDEGSDHVARAARTHLVIRVREGKPEAELLQWESGLGPRRVTPTI
jgi:UDP-2,3-diacylglucosamine pyrophosphatase LpxH